MLPPLFLPLPAVSIDNGEGKIISRGNNYPPEERYLRVMTCSERRPVPAPAHYPTVNKSFSCTRDVLLLG